MRYNLAEDLSPEKWDLVKRVALLASEKFAARAGNYDRAAQFPAADFRDLFHAGLNAATVPKVQGGLGLGPFSGDVFTLWMITKEIAKADLSMARCWEGHVNSMCLLDGCASETQKRRWFEGVVNRGDIWVTWSGEPQAMTPGQKSPYGTHLRKVDGGYRVRGSKVFSSSATGADWAILLVNTAGPGGARHAKVGAKVLMLACPLSDSSVECDDSWWDPIGMRGTVSHLVRFNDTFIPEANAIGYPGQYLEEGWQTCFTPQYAASFLGAADGAYDYAVEYLVAQHKTSDPYIQHHVGEMSINIETGQLWLRHVAQLWEAGQVQAARIAGARARYIVEQLAEATVKHAIQACGARSLNRPCPLERIYRDLSFYVRHDNADHVLAMIGSSVLSIEHDISFFNR